MTLGSQQPHSVVDCLGQPTALFSKACLSNESWEDENACAAFGSPWLGALPEWFVYFVNIWIVLASTLRVFSLQFFSISNSSINNQHKIEQNSMQLQGSMIWNKQLSTQTTMLKVISLVLSHYYTFLGEMGTFRIRWFSIAKAKVFLEGVAICDRAQSEFVINCL